MAQYFFYCGKYYITTPHQKQMTENRTLIHVLDVNILSVYTCSIIHKEIKDCYAYFCFALGEKKRRGGSENTCLSVSVQLQFFFV